MPKSDDKDSSLFSEDDLTEDFNEILRSFDEEEKPAELDGKTASSVDQTDSKAWGDKTNLPGQLALDIYESKDKLFVKCRVAGVNKEDINITITPENMLTIRGALKNNPQDNIEKYFVQECYYGEFSRSVVLPIEVAKDNKSISAKIDSGILTIAFKKSPNNTVYKIDIP